MTFLSCGRCISSLDTSRYQWVRNTSMGSIAHLMLGDPDSSESNPLETGSSLGDFRCTCAASLFIIGKINKAFARSLKVGDVEAAISRKLLGRFDPHSRLSCVYLVCPNRRSSTGYPLSFLDSFLTRRVPKMHQDATEARAPPFLASGFERATSNAGKRIAMNVKIGSTSE